MSIALDVLAKGLEGVEMKTKEFRARLSLVAFGKGRFVWLVGGLFLFCANASAYDFSARDIALDKCKNVAGSVPDSTEGLYNEGVVLCPLRQDVRALGLNKGELVVIKWLSGQRAREDAEKECAVLKMAAGSASSSKSSQGSGSMGGVHCYGCVGSNAQRKAGLVMEPLKAIELPPVREIILASIERGNLVSAPLVALSNLHKSNLGCGDCEWAWVAEGRGVAAKFYDTGGPATQLNDSKKEQALRLKCGQYKSVFDFMVKLTGDIQILEDAPALAAEAEKLYSILAEFDEGAGADGIQPVADLRKSVWPQEPEECPDFCVASQRRLAAWFMGRLSALEEGGGSQKGSGRGRAAPLRSIEECVDPERRCSSLSAVVFSFLRSVDCQGTLPGINLPDAIISQFGQAMLQKEMGQKKKAGSDRIQQRLQERREKGRQGKSGTQGGN